MDDIVSAFEGLGVTAELRVAPRRRSESITWLALVALPLSSFFSTLGASLAKDAYQALRDLTERVLSGEKAAQPGTLVLEDRDSGTRVVLAAGLSNEAYQALLATDLSAVEPGSTLAYDATTRRWSPGT
jgi:hypothetical protein